MVQIKLPFGNQRFCKDCGSSITRHAKTGYCVSCASKEKRNSFFGKKHSAETRAKMSKNHADVKGRNNPNFGKSPTLAQRFDLNKPLCIECQKKHQFTNDGLCRSCCRRGERSPMFGKPHLALDRNPNWKGGVSQFPYPAAFNKRLKLFIRERDGHVCQNCKRGKPEIKKLDVHHIDYYKKNLDPFNLILLCTGCNAKANTNRDKWKIFYQEMQRARGIHPMTQISPRALAQHYTNLELNGKYIKTSHK